MRYFKVVTKTLSVVPSIHGETVHYAALIPALTTKAAEKVVRKDPRFRRTMRQNGLDYKTVSLTIKRHSLKAGL